MAEKREEEIDWEKVCENLGKLSGTLKEAVGSTLMEEIRVEIKARSGLQKEEIEKALLTFQIKKGDIEALQQIVFTNFLYQFLLNKEIQVTFL